jgi:hypothetical protein
MFWDRELSSTSANELMASNYQFKWVNSCDGGRIFNDLFKWALRRIPVILDTEETFSLTVVINSILLTVVTNSILLTVVTNSILLTVVTNSILLTVVSTPLQADHTTYNKQLFLKVSAHFAAPACYHHHHHHHHHHIVICFTTGP